VHSTVASCGIMQHARATWSFSGTIGGRVTLSQGAQRSPHRLASLLAQAASISATTVTGTTLTLVPSPAASTTIEAAARIDGQVCLCPHRSRNLHLCFHQGLLRVNGTVHPLPTLRLEAGAQVSVRRLVLGGAGLGLVLPPDGAPAVNLNCNLELLCDRCV
jgi:hypothetical protein